MNNLITYENEGNLGNTIQTLGLAHLISPSKGIPYYQIKSSKLKDGLLICNGWFGSYPEVENINAIFCGVHLTRPNESIINWLRTSTTIIGARDPATADYLNNINIRSEFIGCGSLMFPYYDGPRSGDVSVDFNGPGVRYTHRISPSISWAERWVRAREMIEIYKTASVVYTNRLHVALPCLAMGTPVYVEDNADKGRFSILDAIGIKYNQIQKDINTSWLRDKYKSFLESQIGAELNLVDPIMPC